MRFVWKVKFNGTVFSSRPGHFPYASYSGPDKNRGTVKFHKTREAAAARAGRSAVGSFKTTIPERAP